MGTRFTSRALNDSQFSDASTAPSSSEVASSEDTDSRASSQEPPSPDASVPDSTAQTMQESVTTQDDNSAESRTVISGQNVAVQKEDPELPLWQKIKVKLAGWFAYWATYIGGLEGLQKYKGDLDNLGIAIPLRVIAATFALGIIAFVGWFLYEVADHFIEKWSKRSLTNALVNANSTPTNQVVAVPAEMLDSYAQQGWVVLKR